MHLHVHWDCVLWNDLWFSSLSWDVKHESSNSPSSERRRPSNERCRVHSMHALHTLPGPFFSSFSKDFIAYKPTSKVPPLHQHCTIPNLGKLASIGTCRYSVDVRNTVNREFFVATKTLRWSPSTTEIKPTKYFLQHINGVSLYCRMVIVTKKGENLTDKIFYLRKNSRSTVCFPHSPLGTG